MYKKNRQKIFILFLAFLFSQFLINKVNAATLSFSPANSTVVQQCEGSVDLIADVSGESSNAADVEINYNPADIDIITPVKTGNAYEAYFYNNVDSNLGKIKIAAGSFANNLNSKKTFATLKFKSKTGKTSTDFSIRFDGIGSTLDSNIADSSTSNDILQSAGSAHVDFTSGNCVKDTQGPSIQFISPYQYQQGFIGNILEFSVSDNMSGVNISSLNFEINGVIYKVGDAEVTYTGTQLKYNFKLQLNSALPSGQLLFFKVSGSDNAGNFANQQIVFNIPVSAISYPESICSNVTETVSKDYYLTTSELCTPTNAILKSINDNVIFKNSFIPDGIKSIGLDGLLALGLVIFSLISLLSYINAPILLFNFIGVLLGAKHKQPIGIVIDIVTRNPIALATCKLYRKDTKFMETQTITDFDGKFGFSNKSGDFRLEVYMNGFQTYKTDITISENNKFIGEIYLVPDNIKTYNFESKFKKIKKAISSIYNYIRPIVFTIGFGFSILSLLLAPIVFNIIVFIIYLLVIVIILLNHFSNRSKFAAVIDSKTNLRIPFTLVRFYDLRQLKVIDTQITNSDGLFDFYGNEGEYGLSIDLRDYHFPSARNEFPLIDNSTKKIIRVHLKKGKNNIKLYLDPINLTPTSGGNLMNPFE